MASYAAADRALGDCDGVAGLDDGGLGGAGLGGGAAAAVAVGFAGGVPVRQRVFRLFGRRASHGGPSQPGPSRPGHTGLATSVEVGRDDEDSTDSDDSDNPGGPALDSPSRGPGRRHPPHSRAKKQASGHGGHGGSAGSSNNSNGSSSSSGECD